MARLADGSLAEDGILDIAHEMARGEGVSTDEWVAALQRRLRVSLALQSGERIAAQLDQFVRGDAEQRPSPMAVPRAVLKQ